MPKRRENKAGSSNPHTNAPAIECKFLRELCRRASTDAAVARAAAVCPVPRAARIFVSDIPSAISISPSGSISMRSCLSATAGAIVVDSQKLHRLLCGASNLMIALNKSDLSHPEGESYSPDSLRLLLSIQPALSHIYRKMRTEKSFC